MGTLSKHAYTIYVEAMIAGSITSTTTEAGPVADGGLTQGVGMTPCIPHSCNISIVTVRLSGAKARVVQRKTSYPSAHSG